MGYLEQILAQVDNAKRVAGRNISDLVVSPAQYAEKMVGHLRNQNANVVPTATPTELTNRPMTRDEIANKYVDASMDTLSGGLGVIKPKGGNWLSGKYGPENQLKTLKKSAPPEQTERLLAEGIITPEGVAQVGAVDNWIDKQLTKYIKNDMASPTDPVRLMLDKFSGEKAQKLAQAEARVAALRQKQQAQAATRGVPEEMLTRTRQDVLKAEEARDLIAENKGLHFDANLPENMGNIEAKRQQAGFPAEGMATTPMGQQWEGAADRDMLARQARDFQLYENIRQDPWLAKADPNATIYSLPYGAGNFKHLTDELTNSLREGRLTPEQIQKMPVDQAVRHVAEINALRAVEANKARAMDMADMPIYKDYPESGMSWRQLKQVGDQGAWQQQFNARKAELLAESKLKGTKWARDSLDKKIEAELGSSPYQKLERWLKQEGDAMGHCVGGYCDDVASGASDIYSLRDAKGKPYVTIETNKQDALDYVNADDVIEKAWAEADRLGKSEADPDYYDWMDKVQAKIAAEMYPGMLSRVTQIKGPRNESPDPKYFPMIQDFIRSGKWFDIQDAGNTGLTPAEIQQILKGQQ